MTNKQFSNGQKVFAAVFAVIALVFCLVFTGIIKTDADPTFFSGVCIVIATAIAGLWVAALFSRAALSIIHRLPTWVWVAAFAVFTLIAMATSVSAHV